MQVAHFSGTPQNDIYSIRDKRNSLKCSCEKLEAFGKTFSVCDICSEKEFFKRSSGFNSHTESSTFSADE